MERVPRLSLRLASKLSDEPYIGSLEEHIYERRENFGSRRFIPASADGDDDIPAFVSKFHSKMTPSDNRKLNSDYNLFLAHMSSVLVASAIQESDPIKTMLSILTSEPIAIKAFDEATSYFGKIPSGTLESLHSLAMEIQTVKKKYQIVASNYLSPLKALYSFHLRQKPIKQSVRAGDSNDSKRAQPASSATAVDYSSKLVNICYQYTKANPEVMFSFEYLVQEVSTLVSDPSSELLESRLFDLFGENGVEFIMQIAQDVSYFKQLDSDSIRAAIRACTKHSQSSSSSSSSATSSQQRPGASSFSSSTDPFDLLKKIGFKEEYLNQEKGLGFQKDTHTESWR